MIEATKKWFYKRFKAVDGRAVANEFCRIAEEKGDKLNRNKLQFMVYYAHGWHLAFTGMPLIKK